VLQNLLLSSPSLHLKFTAFSNRLHKTGLTTANCKIRGKYAGGQWGCVSPLAGDAEPWWGPRGRCPRKLLDSDDLVCPKINFLDSKFDFLGCL